MTYLLLAVIGFLAIGWVTTVIKFDKDGLVSDCRKLRAETVSLKEQKTDAIRELLERDEALNKLLWILGRPFDIKYEGIFMECVSPYLTHDQLWLISGILSESGKEHIYKQTIHYLNEKGLSDQKANEKLKSMVKNSDRLVEAKNKEIEALKKDIEHASNSLAIYRDKPLTTESS